MPGVFPGEVPMTAAAATATEPPPPDEMTLESNARIARMDARLSAAKGDNPKPVVPVAAAPAAEVVPDTAAKEPAPADTPSAATPKAQPVDLSFIDEAHRSHFEKLPPEAIAYLKGAALRQSDYTQKTQEIAKRKADLETYDSILADEEALAALIALRDKRAGKVVEEDPDYDPLDPEQRKAHDAALVAKAKAETKADLTAEQRAAAEVKAERTEIANHVLGNLTAKGYATDQIEAKFLRFGGFDGMKAMAKASGAEFSKEYVEAILSEALPPVAPKKEEPKAGSVAAKSVVTSEASAVGRNAGGFKPNSLPAFMREGKAPSNLQERIAESLALVNEKRAARGLPPITDD